MIKGFCGFLSIIVIVISISGTELRLKNGTVYKGNILTEEGNYFSIQVGSSRLTINKSLVAEKDGIQYQASQPVVDTHHVSETIPRTNDRSIITKTDTLNETSTLDTTEKGRSVGWTVMLINGDVFTGKKIGENQRSVILESNKVPVTIFKNMISNIDSGIATGSPSDNNQNAKVHGNTTILGGANKKSSIDATDLPNSVTRISPEQSATPNLKGDTSETATPEKSETALISSETSHVTGDTITRLQIVSSPELNTKYHAPMRNSIPLPPPRARTTTVAVVAAAQPSGSEQNNTGKSVALEEEKGDIKVISPPLSFSRPTQDTVISDTSVPVVSSQDKKVVIVSMVSSQTVPPPKIIPKNVPIPPHTTGKVVSPAKIISPPSSVSETKQDNGISDTGILLASSLDKKVEIISMVPSQTIPPPKTPPQNIPIPSTTEKVVSSSPPPIPLANVPMSASTVSEKRYPRPDGKHELTLMNGTVFIGTIERERSSSIVFAADGAVITILKQLIKEIDGQAYAYQKPKTKKPLKPISNREPSSKDDRQRSSRVKNSLFRIMPVATLPQGMTITDLVDSMQNKRDWGCRSKAVRLVGAMGQWGSSAMASVAALLDDTAHSGFPVPVWIDSTNVEPYLAPGLEAARALAQLGTQGIAVLMRVAKEGKPLVRRNAVFGLGNCFYPAAEKVVTAALTDKDPGVRRTALGSLRQNTALPALSNALHDADGSVRSAAALLIGKLGDKEALPVILQMTKDKSSEVRAAIADAIGTLGSKEEIPTLVSLSRDNNNFVRAAAIRSLGTIDDSTVIDPLIMAAGDESAEVRICVAEALGELRNSRAIPSLYAMLKDNNGLVREKAQYAVRLHTEMPLLIDALDNESNTVRNNAAYILWLLTGQDFGDNKKEWEAWAAAHPGKQAVTKSTPH